MDDKIQRFGVYDYIVLALVLVISSAIGIYYRLTGGKQKTAREYLLADRSMPMLPVAISLMASLLSSITLLGVCSENYTFGSQFIVINISYGISTPIICYLFLPIFFKLQCLSVYEYLGKRFGPISRLVASLCYTFQMILYMGIVLYAPALTLEAVTGISQLTAILGIGLVCTFYSTIGGMKAVLMTDVFQALLMFVAVFSIIICAVMDVGFTGIWRIASDGGRLNLFNFSIDPTERHTWFTLIIGGLVTYISMFTTNQTQVQRYLTVKDLKTAQKAVWVNWPIFTGLVLSTSFSGLAIYSKYYKCDPVCSGKIATIDQLMPYYVIDNMGHIPGLSGLFVAGIFSGSISSMSACLNSLAAVTIEDYYKPLYKKLHDRELPQSSVDVQSKVIVFSFGLACIAVAFLAQFLGGILQASLTIFGVVSGPLLSLFTLGMFTTTANQKGALLGLLCGISFAMWMAFGTHKPLVKLALDIDGCDGISVNLTNTCSAPPVRPDSEYFWLHRVSYLYNGLFGFIVTFVVGWCTSFVISRSTKSGNKKMNPDLFIPPLARKMEKYWDEPLNMKNAINSEHGKE